MSARILQLLCVALWLSACGQEDRQVPVPVPVVPAPAPLPPAPAAPATPAPRRVDAPGAAVSPADKPVAKAPSRPLDLSLPEGWAGAAGQPAEEGGERSGLLPPLFDSPVPPAVYQLGGRLIPDDRQEQIEGAEISIQIRH